MPTFGVDVDIHVQRHACIHAEVPVEAVRDIRSQHRRPAIARIVLRTRAEGCIEPAHRGNDARGPLSLVVAAALMAPSSSSISSPESPAHGAGGRLRTAPDTGEQSEQTAARPRTASRETARPACRSRQGEAPENITTRLPASDSRIAAAGGLAFAYRSAIGMYGSGYGGPM